MATTNQHPPVNVKDLRNNRQESSNSLQLAILTTNAGYLTDAQHYCQPREQSPSDYDYTAAAKKSATVNKTAISAVDDNDRPAEAINYYGQCRTGHAFQVDTPIIDQQADAAGSKHETAPPTPTPLGTAKAITDVSGSMDIDIISAETEIKTTGIDSAKESDKLLLESTDNGEFCNDAVFYNGTRKSYNTYRQKNRQINAAKLETSVNAENFTEKYRVTDSISEAEINEHPTSEKAEIKIGQQSETTISARDSKINTRTHQTSKTGRRKKRDSAKQINGRKKQMMAAKETRRPKNRRPKKRDSAKRTAGRPKKSEERAPDAMITTPATSTIPETVEKEVVEVSK